MAAATDVTSTGALDTPDTTAPYLDPLPMGDTAFVVAASFVPTNRPSR
jgi:hypothetical protein